MASSNFYDDDLSRQRDWGNRGNVDEPAVPVSEGGSLNAAPRAVADLNLTRMARHKKELDEQAAQALQELEKLRKRQESVESEKRNLETLRRQHDDFDRGKREMTDHLQRSLVILERQEAEAQRLSELYNATRARFKQLLASVQALNEESWPDDQIRDELNKSIGVIEEVRMEYNKAMARVEAERNTGGPADSKSSRTSAVLFEEGAHHEEPEKDFMHWLKVGAAVTLPLVVLIAVALIVYFIGRANGYF